MNRMHALLITACLALPLAAGAESDPYQTPDDFLAWLKKNQTAKPQFVDGDLIGFGQAELIRPFLPPAFQEEMIFEGMQVQIKDAGDLTPADVYKTATEKYYGQATIGSDRGIQNYTAGLPFDPAKFTPGSAEDGVKLAWNFNFRWQNDGLRNTEVHWVWVRRGGEHAGHNIMNDRYSKFYGGGGTFERVLSGPYQRVYFSHVARLADQNYTVEGAWAKNTEFREYTGFVSPFDIAGTAFLILRYDEPQKTDDSWAYIPSLRRVRRISVEVKSDSLLGTDHTLEDFYCFAGRPVEWEWKYIGEAQLLAVARSRYRYTRYYGPNGWIPLDDWSIRKVDVLQATPTLSWHPYSTKFLMIDRDSAECYYSNAYDRSGTLWKLWQLTKVWTDDPWFQEIEGDDFKPPYTAPGVRVSAFHSINVIDKQNDRGTLVPVRGNSYPTTALKDVKRSHDVNRLTEGR
jgi:hypothetical protein